MSQQKCEFGGQYHFEDLFYNFSPTVAQIVTMVKEGGKLLLHHRTKCTLTLLFVVIIIHHWCIIYIYIYIYQLAHDRA